jgi:hypothetical protein
MEIKIKLKDEEIQGMMILCQEYIKQVDKQDQDDTTEMIKSILSSCLNKFESARDRKRKRSILF